MSARPPAAPGEKSFPVHYGYSLDGRLFVASDDGTCVALSPQGALRLALDFLGLSEADLAAVAERRGRPLRGLIDAARDHAAGEPDPDVADTAAELIERGFRIAPVCSDDMDEVGHLAQELIDRGFRWRPDGDSSLGWWVIPTGLGDYRVTNFASDYAAATRRLSRIAAVPV